VAEEEKRLAELHEQGAFSYPMGPSPMAAGALEESCESGLLDPRGS